MTDNVFWEILENAIDRAMAKRMKIANEKLKQQQHEKTTNEKIVDF